MVRDSTVFTRLLLPFLVVFSLFITSCSDEPTTTDAKSGDTGGLSNETPVSLVPNVGILHNQILEKTLSALPGPSPSLDTVRTVFREAVRKTLKGPQFPRDAGSFDRCLAR